MCVCLLGYLIDITLRVRERADASYIYQGLRERGRRRGACAHKRISARALRIAVMTLINNRISEHTIEKVNKGRGTTKPKTKEQKDNNISI